MYFEMLAAGNKEFVDGITRAGPRFRTQRLDQVVSALEAAQKVPAAQTMLALLNAMHSWRTHEPAEFANRGGSNGVAYRLWLETRQTLRNRYHQNFNQADPPMPANCPGVLLLGTYVPEGEGQVEICHGFAYRWAIASGKMTESPTLQARKGGSFNAANTTPVLYPVGFAGYPSARVAGVMQLQPGDIVAMFLVPPHGPPSLGHSLIAETSTIWFSANNAGTFGVGTGRSRIDTTHNFGVFAGHQVGWVGGGNQWMRPDGVAVDVVYRR